MDANSSRSLRLVFSIFRHGARAPLRFTPNDVNKQHWSVAPGSLTDEGKRQAYQLGLWYRRHYGDFLSGEESSAGGGQLYAYSTDTERTQTTARCCLAALYPADEPSTIPVHSIKLADDINYLDFQPVRCERLPQSKSSKERHVTAYQNYLNNQALWDKWFRFVGERRIDLVLLAVDAIGIELSEKLPVELPADTDFRSDVTHIRQTGVLFLETLPRYMQCGAHILSTILAAMNANVDGSSGTKLYLYSMHDLNIFVVLGLLDVPSARTDYCGQLTFELHLAADGQFYVKLQHRLRYDSELQDIPLTNNDGLCPLSKFAELVEAAQQSANNA